MRTEILKNRILTIIYDGQQEMAPGTPQQGTIVVKSDNKNILFTPHSETVKRPTVKNPLVYEGEFLSSRFKKNGRYSIHAVINSGTDFEKTRVQAHTEIDSLFDKLKAFVL